METNGPSSNSQGKYRKILVVDDSEDTATSMARLLAYWGLQVEVARDVKSALDALDARTPDVVITDLALPDRDGREIARHARGLPQPPVCLLMTGWPLEEGPDDLAASGVDHLFQKPVDFSKLHAFLFPATDASRESA
jgi:DNA-binding response OmpR family regulator